MTNEEDPLVTELKKRLRSVSLDGQTFYLAEGDLALAEGDLLAYATRPAVVPDVDGPNELLGITRNGKVLRWRPGFVLRYCVLRKTFSDDEYKLVTEAMTDATGAWEKTCG